MVMVSPLSLPHQTAAGTIPMILNGIISTARDEPGNLSPTVPEQGMSLHQDRLLLSSPGVPTDGRVNLIVPPLTTLMEEWKNRQPTDELLNNNNKNKQTIIKGPPPLPKAGESIETTWGTLELLHSKCGFAYLLASPAWEGIRDDSPLLYTMGLHQPCKHQVLLHIPLLQRPSSSPFHLAPV